MDVQREVLALLERVSALNLLEMDPAIRERINAFRIPARDFRIKGEPGALTTAFAAYADAAAALDEHTKPAERVVNAVLKNLVAEAAPQTADAPSCRVQEPPTSRTAQPDDTLIEVEVAKLVSHPLNARLALDSRLIERLAQEFRLRGFDRAHPVVIRIVDGRMEILGGHHRVEAARLAELTSVPCRIIQATDAEAVRYLARDNLQARPLTKLEFGVLSIAADKYGVAVKDSAEAFGLRPNNLSRYRRAAGVYEHVKSELGEDGAIRLAKCAEHLAAIADAPRSKWLELVRRVLDAKVPSKQLRREVAALRSDKRSAAKEKDASKSEAGTVMNSARNAEPAESMGSKADAARLK
jgi:ParB family chromosome partitioning protein